ncbi:MAG: hypothetical protein A2Y62_00990 [Candidatus Fischerbacteria bacterium RBG_13_37_8]|uniref:Uncharacterized protein n=1 Tax=Candidatus Fischerbacteria bacterium RBG_13_37_8 TaxID=1817863 RepID=A0A1F5VVH2_9BACT|nr:MAG: hypothetical protein A2Y62_00990 [Candidatus Fischerbacteria bacterium RBG_13_37_8]
MDYIKHPEYKKLILETCNKCHVSIFNVYSLSVHGKAIKNNILDAPVCTDCHGEHAIAEIASAESKVSKAKLPKTCSACHDQEKLVQKYNMPGKRFETYYDSYHGIINKYGESFVANCASCHGAHKILPSSDPKSTINVNNLSVTCGKCHPNANANFTRGKVHVRATKNVSFGVYLVRQFYTWFILILMILFISHITADIVRAVKKKRRSS